ncbi:tetratricopeptide repeat protein [Alphaproteobacteria bacterium]|nr:tetratricopeptide repeat protein [Alphaproteobacteria bacterium]
MADIFDEVSEELKQDQLIQFWKKYSKFIISLFILLVLLVSTYQFYMMWNEKKLTESSEQFFSGLEKLDNKDFEKSAEIFLNSSLDQKDGYRVLSIFGLAHSNFENGKISEMVSNYQTIYEDKTIGNYYQDLARILSVMKDNKSNFSELQERLKPILNSPSKLQLLAAEMEIVLFIRFNKLEKARNSIKLLLARADITQEQKNRLSLIDKVYNSHAK